MMGRVCCRCGKEASVETMNKYYCAPCLYEQEKAREQREKQRENK